MVRIHTPCCCVSVETGAKIIAILDIVSLIVLQLAMFLHLIYLNPLN